MIRNTCLIGGSTGPVGVVGVVSVGAGAATGAAAGAGAAGDSMVMVLLSGPEDALTAGASADLLCAAAGGESATTIAPGLFALAPPASAPTSAPKPSMPMMVAA